METYEYNGKVYHEVESRLLWSLGHYDGPMSGIALYNGRPHYAKCHQWIGSKKPRYFWLYPLTDEEIRQEQLYQEMFRHYYGPHCDYEEDGFTRKTSTSTPNWSPGLLDFTGLRFLDFIIGLMVGPFINKPKDAWKPCYSEMEKAAGLNRGEYFKREAVGYFRRVRKEKVS